MPSASRAGRFLRRRATIAALLAPAVLLYVVFVIVPIVQGIYYSLFKWNGLKPLTDFVGLDNYARALGDPLFTHAVGNNLLIVVLTMFVQIPIALGLAVFLNERFPGRRVFRVIFFLPYVISEVITGTLFYLLLQPNGAFNLALEGIGLGALAQDWFGSLQLVMPAMFAVITWKYFGFHMIVLLAGLQNVPRELEEAARVDGATPWQAFRGVTLPLLGPTLRVSVFLSIIGSLQIFDVVWATTRGGPVHASDTMATYMIDFGFKRQLLGYGSAVSVLLFLMCLVFALLYQRFVLRRDVDGAITRIGG